MDLIHFQGLNCYQDCVISIANHFGVNYPAAFATLWSETDFRYDPYREAYLTKRMISNLEILGAKVEYLPCASQKDTDESLSLMQEGEYAVVGVDAFCIPWNQFYQIFHGPHYFILENAKAETLLCFDPTYGKGGEHIARDAVTENTFDLIHVSRVAEKPFRAEAIEEAREVLRTHPDTCKALLAQIHDCVHQDRETIVLLAKWIDAMICNRYLYRFFLEHQPSLCNKSHLLLNDDYFLKWKAVKNGLYKAAINKSKENIIADICDYFSRLIEDEMTMAQKIIS